MRKREYDRQYHKLNRAKLNIRGLAWYHNNRQAVIPKVREYYLRTREQRLAYAREYRLNHPYQKKSKEEISKIRSIALTKYWHNKKRRDGCNPLKLKVGV